MSDYFKIEPCCDGHEQDPTQPLTCLIPDETGEKHQVPRWARHCTCHGIPVLLLGGKSKVAGS